MEILVVVLVLVLLMCVLLPGLVQSKRSSQLTGCLANLKQVMLAQLLWINDNEKGQLSWQIPVKDGGTMEYLESGQLSPHFKAFSNELVTTEILTCPADNRAVARDFSTLRDSNMSYFMNMNTAARTSGGMVPLEKLLQSIIFGDRNITNSTGPTAGIISLTKRNYTSLGWNGRMHNSGRNPL